MACDLLEAMSVRVGRGFSWSMLMAHGRSVPAWPLWRRGGRQPASMDDEIHSRFGEGEQAEGP